MRKCQGCSKRLFNLHRFRCDYCSNRYFGDELTLRDHTLGPRNAAARARMAAMDKASRPRVNPRDALELAKPHPWECDESAP